MEKRSVTTFLGNPLTLLGKEIKVGDKAPEFTCLKEDLSPFHLSDLDGTVKLLSIVPSVDTPLCEAQTVHFNQEAGSFPEVSIVTISCDLPFAQSRFCGTHGIDKAIVVSDHKDSSFGLNYGFLIEELRLLNRGIVIIDQENIVRYIDYVKENTELPDYDKALQALKTLLQ